MHSKFIAGKLTIEAVKSTLGFAMLLALTGVAPSISAQSLDGKFDVGSRHIRLACQGSGYPIVVIDAGLWRTAPGSRLHRRPPLSLVCVYRTEPDLAEATQILSRLSRVWIQQPIWIALWRLLASTGLF